MTPTWSRLAHPKARDWLFGDGTLTKGERRDWLFGDGTPTKGDVGDANVKKTQLKCMNDIH